VACRTERGHVMEPDLGSVRHQLALLARRKRARVVGWARQWPSDWRPTQVINPANGRPFTPAGAWEYLATVLAERLDIPLQEVELEIPPGAKAYVLLIPLGDRTLYVKLQLGSGQIIGRSFHYSHYEGSS